MITGDDFIQWASKWVVNPSAGEVAWRTATSRAYYGAYHMARSLLCDSMGIPDCTSNDNSHHYVQHALINSKNTDASKAGSVLGTLRENRNKADYEIGRASAGKQAAAMESYKLADQVRDLLKQCDATAQAQMKPHILHWKQVNQK